MNKKNEIVSNLVSSWASRIRTYVMTESESVALPLGDSPPTRNDYT